MKDGSRYAEQCLPKIVHFDRRIALGLLRNNVLLETP